MKIRSDFVTNSSSSSFIRILVWTKDGKFLNGGYENGDGFVYGKKTFSGARDSFLSKLKSGDELINAARKWFSNGLDGGDAEDYEYGDSDEIRELSAEKISSVNLQWGCHSEVDWFEKEYTYSYADEATSEAPGESTSSDFRMVPYGHYPQTKAGTDTTPIEWLVLEVDEAKRRALLLSRHGLDAKPYNAKFDAVTWETCTLRAWLNDTFLNAAFTDSDQSFILQTQIDNSKSQGNSYWDHSHGGNDTQDRIFLLSFAEAKNYCENNPARRCAATPFAVAQGADTYHDNGGKGAGWWWLRSPGYSQFSAAVVDKDGPGFFCNVENRSICVRPAFWISLESGIF